MAHPGLKELKLLPAHVIPFPLYPFVQEHAKAPTMFVHDPPAPGFAQLSMPNTHSSISVVPINGGSSKVTFKRFLIQAAEYDSIRAHNMKFFPCVRRATEPSPAEEKPPQVRFGYKAFENIIVIPGKQTIIEVYYYMYLLKKVMSANELNAFWQSFVALSLCRYISTTSCANIQENFEFVACDKIRVFVTSVTRISPPKHLRNVRRNSVMDGGDSMRTQRRRSSVSNS